MSKEIPYCARVSVMSADMSANLGLGTHLGEEFIHELGVKSPKILLDTDECIYGFECWWRDCPGTPAREPFLFAPKKTMRLFEASGRGITLTKAKAILPVHVTVTVLRLELRDYDHRPQVAAVISNGIDTFYILTEEMEFPRFGQ